MANRKSDTDRRLNKYFALSQLRKRGGKGKGGGLRVWRIGGDIAPLPIPASPLLSRPSNRGYLRLSPLWVACRVARVRGSYFSARTARSSPEVGVFISTGQGSERGGFRLA